MVTFTEQTNGLLITPDDIEELKEATDLHEAFEDQLCNEWEVLQPEQVGALTDGMIITNDSFYNDDGDLQGVGVVYWDSNYQVTDTLEELREGRSVVWHKSK